jgi:CheY-like chemotaxis protein/anti-sigma regulatory factor (Ser/Thr protein kinase)
MNLITNAFHAMEDSGGKLEINLEEVELAREDLKTPNMKPGRYICLSVCDTGIGIHRNDLDRIFDPYFTTKDAGKGTGLGLSIVNSLVQSYHGEIMVYSELGKGTVFKIFIPVIESVEAPDVISESIDHLKGSESILVVDDDPDVLSLEKTIFERLGYNVTVIDNSPDLLEIFAKNPHAFDIVITDMTMPKMTGDLLAREIMDIRPDIPVILCTGFSEKMSKEKAKEAGFKGFIMKPIIRKEIAKTIRRALGDPVE